MNFPLTDSTKPTLSSSSSRQLKLCESVTLGIKIALEKLALNGIVSPLVAFQSSHELSPTGNDIPQYWY
jgi:hypothetical protein